MNAVYEINDVTAQKKTKYTSKSANGSHVTNFFVFYYTIVNSIK